MHPELDQLEKFYLTARRAVAEGKASPQQGLSAVSTNVARDAAGRTWRVSPASPPDRAMFLVTDGATERPAHPDEFSTNTQVVGLPAAQPPMVGQPAQYGAPPLPPGYQQTSVDDPYQAYGSAHPVAPEQYQSPAYLGTGFPGATPLHDPNVGPQPVRTWPAQQEELPPNEQMGRTYEVPGAAQSPHRRVPAGGFLPEDRAPRAGLRMYIERITGVSRTVKVAAAVVALLILTFVFRSTNSPSTPTKTTTTTIAVGGSSTAPTSTVTGSVSTTVKP